MQINYLKHVRLHSRLNNSKKQRRIHFGKGVLKIFHSLEFKGLLTRTSWSLRANLHF